MALIFGAFIGLERQWQHKIAGIKTNSLVALGSALFVVLSHKILADNTAESRIISQIVTGIGFLAGGVIMKAGFNVQGINTAATIWCSGAIGCLSGMGFGYEAVVGTCIVISANIGLRTLGKSVDKRSLEFLHSKIYHLLIVHFESGSGGKVRREILSTLKSYSNLKLVSFESHNKKHSEPYVTLEIKALQENDEELNSIMNHLSEIDSILGVKWDLDSDGHIKS